MGQQLGAFLHRQLTPLNLLATFPERDAGVAVDVSPEGGESDVIAVVFSEEVTAAPFVCTAHGHASVIERFDNANVTRVGVGTREVPFHYRDCADLGINSNVTITLEIAIVPVSCVGEVTGQSEFIGDIGGALASGDSLSRRNNERR